MTLCISLKFSLHVATLCPVFCHVNSTCFDLSKRSAPSCQPKESAVLCLSFSCQYGAWTHCQGVHLWNYSPYLICFPSLRNHCPVSHVIQCLKNHYLIYCVCDLVESDMKLNVAPIIPPLPEAKTQGNSWNSFITDSPLLDSLFLNFIVTLLLKIFW